VAATGLLDLTATLPRTRTIAAAKAVRIGRARFSLTAGKAKTVPVRLSKKALKALKARRKLKVVAAVTAHAASGPAKTTRRKITLKVAAKRRR
jgi:hypothetical protein